MPKQKIKASEVNGYAIEILRDYRKHLISMEQLLAQADSCEVSNEEMELAEAYLDQEGDD